jgi:hypothetical protein
MHQTTKKSIREMIKQAAARIQRTAGGEAEKGRKARQPGRLPGEAHKAEEITLFPPGWKVTTDRGLCRIVGFIPLSRGSNGGVTDGGQVA